MQLDPASKLVGGAKTTVCGLNVGRDGYQGQASKSAITGARGGIMQQSHYMNLPVSEAESAIQAIEDAARSFFSARMIRAAVDQALAALLRLQSAFWRAPAHSLTESQVRSRCDIRKGSTWNRVRQLLLVVLEVDESGNWVWPMMVKQRFEVAERADRKLEAETRIRERQAARRTWFTRSKQPGIEPVDNFSPSGLSTLESGIDPVFNGAKSLKSLGSENQMKSYRNIPTKLPAPTPLNVGELEELASVHLVMAGAGSSGGKMSALAEHADLREGDLIGPETCVEAGLSTRKREQNSQAERLRELSARLGG